MMLLGRYTPLVLDSWTRPKYLKVSGAKRAKDATIERRFRRYGPYAGLAFWLYLTRDWVDELARDGDGARGGSRVLDPGGAQLRRRVRSARRERRLRPQLERRIVMSATTFAGAAQFAAVTVLEDGGTVAAAVAAAVLLNLRYLAISIAIAPDFEGSRPRRFLQSQMIVDESWAISQVGQGRVDRRCSSGQGSSSSPSGSAGPRSAHWPVTFSAIPARLGFDGALPALFLALLVTQLVDRRAKIAALAGGAIALVLLPITPPGVPVIAASAVCLWGLRKR